MTNTKEDLINHPSHYESEAISITRVYQPIDFCELFGFTIGNAFKYLFRRKHKGNEEQDLKKAEYYLKRAIKEDKTSYKILLELLSKRQIDQDLNDLYNAFVSRKDFLSGFDCTLNGLNVVLDFTHQELVKLKKVK